jgi:putative NIF3 family GTP cyclohydrolase 1 type 2
LIRKILVVGFVFAFGSCLEAASLTARQVIEQIQGHLGVAPKSQTVDTFKAGDPDTPVTGIACTMMATFDVLQRAAAENKNLIITHEPTFYNHQDTTGTLEKQSDQVLADKKKFIADHHLVVWRFHDGWHARRPDGILLGMTKALGWEKFQGPDHINLYTLKEISLNDFAAEVKKTLGIRVLRVVGDPKMSVRKVAFLPGASGSARHIQALEGSDVDVLMIGEAPEWETVEYAADAASEGKHKALVILGHIPSEQEGMRECTLWLRSFISEVPISFIPAKEPFWSPTS